MPWGIRPGLHPVGALGLGLDQLVAGVGGVHLTERCRVDALPCHSLQLDLAVQRHFERENMLAGLLRDLLAVRKQGNGLLVGVDLDFDLAGGAVRKPLGADVDERLIAPPCLIEVEAVFLGPLWFMPGSPPWSRASAAKSNMFQTWVDHIQG